MPDDKTGKSSETTVRLPSSDTDRTVQMRNVQPDSYSERTVKLGASKPAAAEPERTRLVGRPQAEDGAAAPSDDPVTGWLVVVKGPGRGQHARLGLGLNPIGRAPGQRVSLNFGDELISRENHAIVTYDPRGRKFYVQHGGGVNLTYLGEEPVLAPKELASGADINIGNTTLRFVALCGPGFDWASSEQ